MGIRNDRAHYCRAERQDVNDFLVFLAATAIPGTAIGIGIAALQGRIEDRRRQS